MIKAYLKNGTITLILPRKKTITYLCGQHMTTVGEQTDYKNAYTYFDDYNESAMRAFVYTELETIYENKTNSFSPERLLALLDKRRKTPVYGGLTLKAEIVNNEMVFAAELMKTSDLLAVEMLGALMSGKPLQRCVNCGGFFFPEGRTDSLYCTRIGIDGYSCKRIGAHRLYRENSRKSEMKILYDKVTKHNRYLKNKGKLDVSLYTAWMQEAQDMYKKYKNNIVSSSALRSFLEEPCDPPQKKKRNDISDFLL